MTITMVVVIMMSPVVVGDDDDRLQTYFGATFAHRFTGCFSYLSSTGYFSGFSMLSSEAGPICVQSRTTSIGSDSAQFRRILLTGYFFGFSLNAGEANPGCFEPRTTYVDSNLVLTSQSMVTIYLPVDDYVLNVFSLMGL
ncbi:unnamed protein product, partial [Arabidopsis halleri]